MYKKNKLYVLVAFIIFVGVVFIWIIMQQVVEPEDPYEPNDSFKQATGIMLGDKLTGGLLEPGDRDIFQFSVDSAVTVVFFDGDTTLTLALSLTFYGPDTTRPIASNDKFPDNFPDQQRLFAVTETEGIHYLEVKVKTDTTAKGQGFKTMAADPPWGGTLGSCPSTYFSPVTDPPLDNPSGDVEIHSVSASRGTNTMGVNIIRVEITFENQQVVLNPGSAIEIGPTGSTFDLDGWVQINEDTDFLTGHHDPVFGLFDPQIIQFVPVPCTGILAGVEYRVDLYPLNNTAGNPTITLKITNGVSPSSTWSSTQIIVSVTLNTMGKYVLTFDIPEPSGASVSSYAFFLAILGSNSEIAAGPLYAKYRLDFLPNNSYGVTQ